MIKKVRVSRRKVLKAGMAAAVLMGAPSLARAQEQKQRGGHLRLGMAGGSSTDSFDPTTYADSVPIAQGYQIMNGLIEIDEHNRAQPELFESWDVADQAKQWIFRIRKGVTFHNGKSLDADDILYSLNLHRGDASKSGAKSLLKPITEITKLADDQIRITLAGSDSDFLYSLGDYHLLVVPNNFTDWQNPVGTGAYAFDHYEPGVRLLTKRNMNYWKEGRGNVDSVETLVINDTQARMNALISGQVDAISRADTKTIGLIKNVPDLAVVNSPGGWHAILAMQTDKMPFTDSNVRRALRYAMDRQQMLETLFNGYGSLGNDHPIPRSDPFYNSELPQIAYDPDKAKFFLGKAGLSSLAVGLSASEAAFDGGVNAAVLYQAAAKKAGVAIDIHREPADSFWSNVWLKAPFCLSYWAGRAAATQMLAVAYESQASYNETHWNNSRFDSLLNTARAETDETKKRTAIWEMQAMLHDDGGALIPVFADWVDACHKRVKGLTPHGIANFDNLRLAEKAWFSA
ncbi:MAG TPA: ABC transporter substrate-binding protein [Dongiaceae bacterium]|jgi:peptide/nickel transport system substrate-binding protein|nr:ABC transporter substrate-binding protein [Dongiaceae bacterium]